MYLKICTNKAELIENKQIFKKYLKIKNKKVKLFYNFLLRYLVGLVFFIKKYFGIITVKNIHDVDILCIIPCDINKNIINNLNQIINKYNIKNLIPSKKLLKLDELKKIDINILNGKYLLKIMFLNVLKYILKFRNEYIENQTIYFLINENSDSNLQFLEYISDKVKSVNIITNKINNFKKLEKYLYEKKGIMVVISNNKRMGLKRAKFIVNIDFTRK